MLENKPCRNINFAARASSCSVQAGVVILRSRGSGVVKYSRLPPFSQPSSLLVQSVGPVVNSEKWAITLRSLLLPLSSGISPVTNPWWRSPAGVPWESRYHPIITTLPRHPKIGEVRDGDDNCSRRTSLAAPAIRGLIKTAHGSEAKSAAW